MAFAEQIRMFLEGASSSPTGGEEVHRHIDEVGLRQHLLRRLGVWGASPDTERSFASWIAAKHAEWTPRITSLVRYAERLPLQEAPTQPAAAQSWAERLLDCALGRPFVHKERLLEQLELRRLLDQFDAPTYALENVLVVRDGRGGRGMRVSAIGQTFLRLRGKDAIRWLLTVETSLSQGDNDPWHVDRRLLEAACSPAGLTRWVLTSCERLSRMDLFEDEAPVAVDDDSNRWVRETMRDVVQAVLEPGPWHTAIRALLEDERAAVLPGLASITAAADATIEQTRMITHEVRNALVPVRGNLDAALTSTTGPARERIERARGGVVRVLGFVDQLVTTAELISEPATTYDLAEAVREALAQGDEGDRVTIEAPPRLIPIHAPRSRLVMALANLVRNAVQAAPAPAPVRISWSQDAAGKRIQVDDGGPGVAPDDRERIFDDGFTTRPGGSGFGLALVKRFVETNLRGKVWSEASDLGGARFVISIPAEPAP